MSNGVVSVEARADSPAVLEAIAILLGVYESGDGYDSSATKGSASTVHYGIFDSDSVVRSAGFKASINTPMVDLVGGSDMHWYGSRSAPETSFGLRKRFPKTDSGSIYLEILGRHGRGLDTNSGQKDYDGVAIGWGVITQIGDHVFVDLGLEYERTLDQIDLSHDDQHLSGFSLRIGLGLSL